MKSKKIILLSFIAAIILFIACITIYSQISKNKEKTNIADKNSSETSTEATMPPRNQKDYLVIGVENDILTTANSMLYNGLFSFDPLLNPLPSLADSYEKTSEKQWIIKLKEGIQFHDGSPLTSSDVKASLEKASDRIKIEIIDNLQFKISSELNEENLLHQLSEPTHVILPKKLLDANNDFTKNAIGTGPYKYKEWISNNVLLLTKNENYFDNEHLAHIPNLEIRLIPNDQERTAALESGDIDFLVDVPFSEIYPLQENNKIVVSESTGTFMGYMLLNTKKSPFDNISVRKAINMAISKESIVLAATNGFASPSLTMCSPVLLNGIGSNIEKYNVDAAKSLLANSQVDPSSITFDIIYKTNTNKIVAEVIQTNLSDIGIKTNIKYLGNDEFNNAILSGSYFAAVDENASSSILSFAKSFASSNTGFANITHYSNPDFDTLITLALTTQNTQEQSESTQKALEILSTDLPEIPLFTYNGFYAYNNSIENVTVGLTGNIDYHIVSWK